MNETSFYRECALSRSRVFRWHEAFLNVKMSNMTFGLKDKADENVKKVTNDVRPNRLPNIEINQQRVKSNLDRFTA